MGGEQSRLTTAQGNPNGMLRVKKATEVKSYSSGDTANAKLSPNEVIKRLESQVEAQEAALKDRDNTIRCFKDILSSRGAYSSDYHTMTTEDCRQLVDEMETLRQELESFFQVVEDSDIDRLELPVPPTETSNAPPGVDEEVIMPAHYIPLILDKGKKGTNGALSGGPTVSSMLASIRRSWEDRSEKIMDLHGLLHRAYSRISELNTKVTDEEAKLWYVPKTAPLQNANSSVCEEDDNIGHRPFERMTQETRMAPMVYAAPPLSSSFYDDPVGRVTLADKALLLSLGGDGSLNADVEEAERGQRWRGEYAPFEMPGESLLSGGPAHNEQKPDWINDDGEISIVPVKTVFLNHLTDQHMHRSDDAIADSRKNYPSSQNRRLNAASAPATPPQGNHGNSLTSVLAQSILKRAYDGDSDID